jgi:hypothetical protein
MKVQIFERLSLAAVAAGLALSGSASAQQPPTPGPEHKVLAMDAGTWDATVEMFMPGAAQPMVSKGTEVNTMGCGGLCLISDFKGDFGGMPFHGHGTSTWDPNKKKYVGTWTDSMSSGLSLSEGTYDAAAKKSTSTMEGPDPTGKIVKSKAVVEYKDANTRVMSMSMTGPDGKDVPTMKISYTKKP